MMSERFTIKPQDDYWAVVDNYNEDKVCIINGIHTEIEAIWLCDFMNEQQATIEMYQRRVHKREEQISIIKKYCIKFLTDEQFETIRKELENG